MAAATRVFSNVRLVEHILLQDLSSAEVVRARQINSSIKTVIDGSIALRKVLFLQTDHDFETLKIQISDLKDSPTAWKVLRVHPALQYGIFSNDVSGFRIDPEFQDSSRWALGMWRDMFICQPPPMQAWTLTYSAETSCITTEGSREYACVHDQTLQVQGDTLGDLADVFERLQSAEGEYVSLYLHNITVKAPGWLDETSLYVQIEMDEREARTQKAAEERAIAEATRREYAQYVAQNQGLMEMLEERMEDWMAEEEEDEAAAIEAAATQEAADAEHAKMRRTADLAARVFGTTEMLEHVLRNLSAAEVTRARQINSGFKTRIDNSLPLRRAMFLEADPAPEILLYGLQPPGTPQASDDSDWDSTTEGPAPEPAIETFKVFNLHPSILSPQRSQTEGNITFLLPFPSLRSGMWQNMLICQPPPPGSKLKFLRYTKRYMESRREEWTEQVLVGNTLGDLMAGVAAEKAGWFRVFLEAPRGWEEEGSGVVELVRGRMCAGEEASVKVGRWKEGLGVLGDGERKGEVVDGEAGESSVVVNDETQTVGEDSDEEL